MFDEVLVFKVVIVMFCYKEEFDVFVIVVNLVVDCDYLLFCIYVFLFFDGD